MITKINNEVSAGYELNRSYSIPQEIAPTESNILQKSTLRDAIDTIGNFAIRTAEKGLNVLSGGISGNIGDLQSLLNQQIAVQTEMQKFTCATNIEHSKHETRMSAIRNMRVG